MRGKGLGFPLIEAAKQTYFQISNEHSTNILHAIIYSRRLYIKDFCGTQDDRPAIRFENPLNFRVLLARYVEMHLNACFG
jgi:hypothetical protein